MKYRALRGTRDILPEETQLWQQVEEICRQVFVSYGYQEIRVPTFESTELFSRSIGTSTDIVEKQMYTFLDKKGRSVTLRPEATAGIIRAYIQNALYAKQPITRLYYLGPMYRYERPQSGRYREFYQIGAELIGEGSSWADVEIISLVLDILKKLELPVRQRWDDIHPDASSGQGVVPYRRGEPPCSPFGTGGKGLKLWINSVGCRSCRPGYTKILKESLEGKLSTLCEDCQRRFATNPLRILDCKKDKNKLGKLPKIADYLCPKCKENLREIENHLKEMGITSEIDPWLVRGLDYYTRTIFEVKSSELGGEETIVAGGRYDNLIEDLGGPPTPAVGFSLGLERLLKALQINKSPLLKAKQELDLYFICLGERALQEGVKLTRKLRQQNISVVIGYAEKSLKAHLRQANNSGAKYSAILGEDELARQTITLRNLQTHQQQSIPWAELDTKLHSHL